MIIHFDLLVSQMHYYNRKKRQNENGRRASFVRTIETISKRGKRGNRRNKMQSNRDK